MEDRTKKNKTGFSNDSSRSMSSPSFIEFGQPPYPRSDMLSQSGPLKKGYELNPTYLNSYWIMQMRNHWQTSI